MWGLPESYVYMTAEAVGKGQDFGIKGILVCVCSWSSVGQRRLSELWLYAGKQSTERAKEAECIRQNAI